MSNKWLCMTIHNDITLVGDVNYESKIQGLG
jgi:hypothetical protein